MERQTDDPPKSSGLERWDELVQTTRKLGRQLWIDATERDHPSWPPAWLAFGAAGAVLLAFGFIVFPLATALVGAIAGWTDSGVNWLAAWDLTEVVTDPVRRYLNEHAGALPTTPDVLWVAWLCAGVVLLLLAMLGSTGARIGWALFGIGAAGMVWSESPRPGEWLAVGVAAAWWALFAVLAYRRRASRDRFVLLDTLPMPHRATESGEGDLVLVDDRALTSALSLLDGLSKVLDTAAQAAMDTNTGDGAPPEAIRDRLSQIQQLRRQLRPPTDDPAATAQETATWFTDLCWTLNQVPLLDAAQRLRR